MNQTFDIGSFFTVTDFFALKPAILLCLFGCGILMTDFLIRNSRMRYLNALTAFLGELFVGFAVWQHHSDLVGNNIAERTALNGALVVDGFSVFFNAIFVGSTILAIIISAKYLEQEGEHRGEYYALMLFAQAGMSILAAGHELVTLFVGLELMSPQLLCAGRVPAFRQALERSRDQVSAAGGLLERVAGLWVFAVLRHERLDAVARCGGSRRGA